jgi:hypothetical protein
VTWTSTSIIETIVPATVEVYTTLAGYTTSIETIMYETSTSLCPVTTISTVSGKEVTIIYTSTSLIVLQVPTTIIDYTTYLTTCYETTEVYTTETAYTTAYTTVSSGSTITGYITLTSTIELTSAYTITSTFEPPTTKATVFIPITLATSVPVYTVVTIPSEKTATLSGNTIYSTIPFTSASTVTAPPATTSAPGTTIILSTPTPTTSAPLQVSSNAAAQATNGPMAYAVAGAMALLALA